MAKQTKKTKPKIISKITVIKVGGFHIKILRRGDKVVVRKPGEILFNNLKTKDNFTEWWEKTIDSLEKSTKLDVIKDEIVDNKAMSLIHAKYK